MCEEYKVMAVVTGDRAGARDVSAPTKGQPDKLPIAPVTGTDRQTSQKIQRCPENKRWHRNTVSGSKLQLWTDGEKQAGGQDAKEEKKEATREQKRRRTGASPLKKTPPKHHWIKASKSTCYHQILYAPPPTPTPPFPGPPFCPATGDLYFQGSFNAISKGGLINSQL